MLTTEPRPQGEETTPEEYHDSIRRQLTKHVILANPTVGNPTVGGFKYQLGTAGQDVEISVGGHTIDKKHVTKPQFKVFDLCDELKEIRKKFRQLDTKIDNLTGFESVSVTRGIRAFPIHGFKTYMDKLVGETRDGHVIQRKETDGTPVPFEEQSFLYQLKYLARDLTNRWPQILSMMEENAESHVWDQVKHKLPQAATLAAAHYISIFPVYLQAGEELKIGAEDIVGYEEHFREAVTGRIEQVIDSMVGEPRKLLAEKLNDLHELIQRNGKVTEKSFRPIREAIAKIRHFRFIANDDLLRQIEGMEKRLELTDASELNSTTAAHNGMLTAIEALSNEVTDAEKQTKDFAAFGGRSRGLEF